MDSVYFVEIARCKTTRMISLKVLEGQLPSQHFWRVEWKEETERSLFFPFLVPCTVNLLHCNVTLNLSHACLLWGRYVVVHALGAWWCVVVLGARGGYGTPSCAGCRVPHLSAWWAWCMVHGWWVVRGEWVGCGGLGVCGGHGKKQGGLSSQVLRAVISVQPCIHPAGWAGTSQWLSYHAITSMRLEDLMALWLMEEIVNR